MRSRVVPAVLLIALSFPAFCRTSGVNSVTGVPNDVLYHFFFNRVMWLQDQADKMLAQGKGDGAFRDLIRQQAGLTSQQESALNAIQPIGAQTTRPSSGKFRRSRQLAPRANFASVAGSAQPASAIGA